MRPVRCTARRRRPPRKRPRLRPSDTPPHNEPAAAPAGLKPPALPNWSRPVPPHTGNVRRGRESPAAVCCMTARGGVESGTQCALVLKIGEDENPP